MHSPSVDERNRYLRKVRLWWALAFGALFASGFFLAPNIAAMVRGEATPFP